MLARVLLLLLGLVGVLVLATLTSAPLQARGGYVVASAPDEADAPEGLDVVYEVEDSMALNFQKLERALRSHFRAQLSAPPGDAAAGRAAARRPLDPLSGGAADLR